MPDAAIIRGWAARVAPSLDGGPDRAIVASVRDALGMAGLASLDPVDMVVTCASDIIDGRMVATGSGIAGAAGKEIMTVPSSAGHALAAAASLIESGMAGTVLLAGWGEGTKFAARDGRVIQADPFYARPVGASPAALAALVAQQEIALDMVKAADLEAYAGAMRARAGMPPAGDGAAAWLATGWCDGACALVLAAEGAGVAIRDIGTSFEPYVPDAARLAPWEWIAAACDAMRDVDEVYGDDMAAIEVGGPTPFCEADALMTLVPDWGDARVNRAGGGAVAHFGPATGLRLVATACEALGRDDKGLVADLAGPIGQAATVVLLEGGTS